MHEFETDTGLQDHIVDRYGLECLENVLVFAHESGARVLSDQLQEILDRAWQRQIERRERWDVWEWLL